MSGHAEGQQHPVAIYLWIWGLLFVLSTFSYMVDYYNLQGMLRWSLILLFMFLKAGFIIAIFMHMMWERLALIYAILLPPLLLLVLIALMAIEGNYVHSIRSIFFDLPEQTAGQVEHTSGG
jgi:cytochrome c oxidase subunit 4